MNGTNECKEILTRHNFKFPPNLTEAEVTMALLLRIIEQNNEILMKSKV